MKKTFVKKAAATGLCLSLLACALPVGAAFAEPDGGFPPEMNQNERGFGWDRAPADGRMVISEPGQYILTGEMRGMVYVDPGMGDVALVLDGASLDGGGGPAIMAVSGDRLSIELPAGSVNRVNGGQGSSFGATVFSEVPLSFSGEGRLDMMSNGPEAIYVRQGSLDFNGGDIRIRADQNGMDAPSVNFNQGVVTVRAPQDNFVPGTMVNMNGGAFCDNQGPAEQQRGSGQDTWVPTAPGMERNGGQQPTAPGTNQNGGQDMWVPTAPGTNQNGGQQPMTPGTNQNGGQQPMTPGTNQNGGQQPTAPGTNQNGGQQPTAPGTNQNGGQQPMTPGTSQNGGQQSSTDTAGEIVTGITENSAMSLAADYDNATTYTVTDEDGTVKISSSGTYIVTGSSSEGSITVKKGTTGVVLVLDDLDLTSSSGAALAVNKNAEVQVIVSGNVTLTDAEDPADENSTDADVADAYDGAAIKVKAESVVFITGDGTLTLNGDAKNGIKAGDGSSLIIGGDVTVNINAVNDGINGNYDVTVLSGKLNIAAGDDGIHADHILTIGGDGDGPDLVISKSNEGMEGTVVNITGGTVQVNASDDGINAANGDGTYEGELGYSINMTGGSVTINAGTDGMDSNGNINLVGGDVTIRSANNGGDEGIDYDGDLYIGDGFELNNFSGVAGPDGMGGPGGQMGGFDGMGGPGGQAGGFDGQMGGPGGQAGGFQPGR